MNGTLMWLELSDRVEDKKKARSGRAERGKARVLHIGKDSSRLTQEKKLRLRNLRYQTECRVMSEQSKFAW